MLTDTERREFEQIEDSGDTQGLAWKVEQAVAAHVTAALREAADAMPPGNGSSADYWDGERVEYDLYERSPENKTPGQWLRNRAAALIERKP
jgi:hypothetical protein